MGLSEVKVRYDAAVAARARAEHPEAGWRALPDGGAIGLHRVESVKAFVRAALRWGDAMTVVAPPAAVRSTHTLLAAMLARHRHQLIAAGRPGSRPLLREVK